MFQLLPIVARLIQNIFGLLHNLTRPFVEHVRHLLICLLNINHTRGTIQALDSVALRQPPTFDVQVFFDFYSGIFAHPQLTFNELIVSHFHHFYLGIYNLWRI